jgi:hypothetical protein
MMHGKESHLDVNARGRSVAMSHALVAKDWRKLAQAARKERERDPRKFVYLLKQLFDLVNAGEEKHESKNERHSRRTTRESRWRKSIPSERKAA